MFRFGRNLKRLVWRVPFRSPGSARLFSHRAEYGAEKDAIGGSSLKQQPPRKLRLVVHFTVGRLIVGPDCRAICLRSSTRHFLVFINSS